MKIYFFLIFELRRINLKHNRGVLLNVQNRLTVIRIEIDMARLSLSNLCSKFYEPIQNESHIPTHNLSLHVSQPVSNIFVNYALNLEGVFLGFLSGYVVNCYKTSF